jgi:hypothetical protein
MAAKKEDILGKENLLAGIERLMKDLKSKRLNEMIKTGL